MSARMFAPAIARRLVVAVLVMVSVFALGACSRAITGTPMRAGASDRGSRPQDTYPNLLKECDKLDNTLIGQSVDADPLNIQSTFVGAVCRWQLLNKANVIVDLTLMWFEQGSLDNERKVAEQMQYKIENRSVAGVSSIVMRANDPNGSCGVASDAEGVVSWWVNPQAPGVDACGQAIKLMELSLQTAA
jgi:hypothetical protein